MSIKIRTYSLIVTGAIVLGFAFGIPHTSTGQIKPEEKPELKDVFDEYGVDGTFVLFDVKRDKLIRYNPNRARQRFLPLSTFKIPNSLIALETRIVADEKTILKWSGETYEIEGWNKDLSFSEALSSSCVPCYQQIARQIGWVRMNRFLKRFNLRQQ